VFSAASGIPWKIVATRLAIGIQASGATMTNHEDKQQQPAAAQDAAPDMPFRRLLYRFLFFDWLFHDVSAARDRFERHAAHQHNRKMSRYLPVYLRRWSFLTAFDFALGVLFEKVLQAGILSAWCFTWSCVTFTGMVVITVAWLILNHARLS
jgi:hypothetical protein